LSKSTVKWLKLALQIGVSVALVALALRKIDVAQARALVLRPDGWGWLLAALLLFNLSKIASALRLNVYQRNAAILLSEPANLRLYYAGMFLNMFLPGGIGGDGYKILVLHRRQAAPVRTLVTITLADRVSGLLLLLLLLCALAPQLALPLPPAQVAMLAAAAALALGAVFAAGHRWLLKVRGRRLAQVFGYGLAVQLLQLFCMAALLAYLHAPAAHYVAYLAVFLVSSVAAVLPLSFGGLGAREVTFLYGLGLLQLDPIQGVLAASGFFLVTLVSSLAGIVFMRDFSLAPAPAGAASDNNIEGKRT
jgi:uncharacterized membrane protein YbhN (UPF0104 family)